MSNRAKAEFSLESVQASGMSMKNVFNLKMVLMRVFAAATLIMSFVSSAYPACWRIENLRGYSAKAFESFQVSPDRLGGQTFDLTITSINASLSPSNRLSCARVSATSAVCAATDGEKAIAEVWSVDPGLRKAYQVHSRSGSGQFNGAALFVGDISGTCD